MKEKLQKADERLSTAKLLFENEKYEAALSRAYYGMFHAAKALLETENSSPKTHAGVNSELGKLFRDRIDLELLRDFSRIQEMREDADYGTSSDFTRKQVEEALETAEKFVSKAKELVN